MTNFKENPIKIEGLRSDSISFSRRRVKIRLTLKDGIEGMVFTLTNVFYLLHSLSKLISLGLLKDIRFFYHNNDHTLYNQETQKILAFAKC